MKVEEIERLMDEAAGKSIEILPNGEIRVRENECLSCSQLKAEVETLRQDLMRDSSQDYPRFSKMGRVMHYVIQQLHDPETSWRDFVCFLDQEDAHDIMMSYIEPLLATLENLRKAADVPELTGGK